MSRTPPPLRRGPAPPPVSGTKRRRFPVLRTASTLGAAILDILWPPACRICGADPRPDPHFCRRCLGEIPGRESQRCLICGREASDGPFPGRAGPGQPGEGRGGTRQRAGPCARCRGGGAPYDVLIVAASYEGPVRDLIHRLKFRRERTLAAPLGARVATAVRRRATGAHRVTAVPLHWRRRLVRGYDQSALIAAAVARELGLPFEPSILRRLRATAPQSGLPRADARRANVQRAFAAAPGRDARGDWLLVDDVLSTGATIEQCARALRARGAGRITAAVVAR